MPTNCSSKIKTMGRKKKNLYSIRNGLMQHEDFCTCMVIYPVKKKREKLLPEFYSRHHSFCLL